MRNRLANLTPINGAASPRLRSSAEALGDSPPQAGAGPIAGGLLSGPAGAAIRLLLTAREAAAALTISERTLWELTRRGSIPCVRLGRAVRYDLEDLRKFIQAQKCGGQ